MIHVKPEDCPAVAEYGDHMYVVLGTRRPTHFFRFRRELRCWKCDLRVADPDPNPLRTGM